MARAALVHLTAAGWDFASLNDFPTPSAAAAHWPELCQLLCGLRKKTTWEGQVALVRRWYQPHLERVHDNVAARTGDLDQLEQIAATYPTRGSFLSELTLDPPEATSAEAVPPHLDEDYLVLSTIHSAKGQEWDAVFVLNVIDGCIPSDMAVATREQVEEERRLLLRGNDARPAGPASDAADAPLPQLSASAWRWPLSDTAQRVHSGGYPRQGRAPGARRRWFL